MQQICVWPNAQWEKNGLSPDPNYWSCLKQLIKTCKSLVDAIRNLKSQDADLADCMLELIQCAQQMLCISLWCSSLSYHQLCANSFTHSKIIQNYFALVEMFVLMRETFPLEEFLFEAKPREIFWMPACDLAISARWVVIGTEKGSKSSILHAN